MFYERPIKLPITRVSHITGEKVPVTSLREQFARKVAGSIDPQRLSRKGKTEIEDIFRILKLQATQKVKLGQRLSKAERDVLNINFKVTKKPRIPPKPKQKLIDERTLLLPQKSRFAVSPLPSRFARSKLPKEYQFLEPSLKPSKLVGRSKFVAPSKPSRVPGRSIFSIIPSRPPSRPPRTPSFISNILGTSSRPPRGTRTPSIIPPTPRITKTPVSSPPSRPPRPPFFIREEKEKRKKKKKRKLPRQPKQFTPSLTAGFLGIKTEKRPTRLLAGIEIRPTVKGTAEVLGLGKVRSRRKFRSLLL